MNKLFTKITSLALGAAMMIGVGVSVASNSKEASPVHATETSYTITFKTGSGDGTKGSTSTAMSSYTSSSYVTGNATTATNAYYAGSSGLKLGTSSASGSLAFGLATSGQVTATKVTVNAKRYNSSKAATIKLGNLATQNLTSSFANYEFALTGALTSISITTSKYAWVASVSVYYNASTPLTGITLGGAASQNALSIGSSDLTAKTVSVTLNPLGATDQKVNIVHQSGTSGLFTVSSSATCTSGSGSFTVTGKGNTSGTETFRISGNTQSSVYVDLVVTALDDSVTYWTVSFNSDGGASIADMSVEDGEKFEFPSPGTKTHYSFNGWSSDGGNTLYDAGDESPVVDDDIEYTAYWTQDAQATVIYTSGDGTGSDISSTEYAGSYSLASFPGAWTAPSGKVFSKWSDGSSQYSAGANYTLVGNTTVTFTAVYKAVDEYTLFSGDLVEGDYVICSGTKAMKNETTSAPRIDVADVTVTNNKIVDPDASIIWHIAQDGDYWTIYNAAVEKYAAFTTTNGRGTLIDSVTDYARFSTEDSYEFINVGSSGKYLRYNPTYGFASYSTSTGVSLTLYKAPSNELSSIALSGDYETSFASGETFSFGGTVTASYTKDNPANVTSKTTFHLDSASGTNMSGVIMTHADHDGHTIYAKYTEGGITKTATYTISVENAPVESVSISVNAAEIGLNEEYSVSGITVTVSPEDAIKTYVWTDVSNTVGNDYVFGGTELLSGNTAGTITLRCSSTADSTKYADLVVTVTADPTAEFTPASVSGYVGKSDDISFTYGNMSDTSLISVTSSNSSVVEVDEFVADAGEGLVTVNFVADGSATLSISYNGGSALDTVDVTVSDDSVTALTWSAPTIKVYSGATTTVSDASSWNVHYTMASGDYGSLVYGEYTLKLGGSAITLPHTWDASEDGKVLSIEYGGFVSPTTSTVDVTQSLQAVKAPVEGDPVTKTWNATSGCLGDAIGTVGNTATGSLTFDDESTMSYTRTLEYLASGKADYVSFSSPYQQFGSKNALNTLVLEASNSNKVTEVVVTCWAKDGATDVSVTVGGDAFDTSKSAPSADGSLTFSGSASGNIVITMEKAAKTSGCAQYIASVAITTVESSGETTNIANVAGHEAAQKAVVAFAKAMNAAFDNTGNCTDGVAAAWSTASSAYSSNITNNASLSAEEKAYAKNLIKYASAQYTDDTDTDYSYCLERAMATYEACIQKHGQTGFMNDVRSVSPSSRITPLSLFNDGNSNTVAIIVIISVISITCIGGFFFLRKRKEI